MKLSQYSTIEKSSELLSLWRQVMALVVGEIIKYYTNRNEDGSFQMKLSDLDQFNRQRREFAYQLIQTGDGAVDRYLISIRALFDPTDDSDDLVYTTEGVIDIDASFAILYQKVTEADLFNVLAGAKAEMVGVY